MMSRSDTDKAARTMTKFPQSATRKTQRRSGGKPPGRARKVLARPPAPPGWQTSDEDEIRLRRWRGQTEIVAIEALEPVHPFFGTYRVRSDGGGCYDVEIRSLEAPVNSCGCPDHRVNGLGTCKHIEGVLAALGKPNAGLGGVRAFRKAAAAGSPRAEIFVDRGRAPEPAPVLIWPQVNADVRTAAESDVAQSWLAPWLTDDRALVAEPDAVADLLAAWPAAPEEVRRAVRLSRHLELWIDRQRRLRTRATARDTFLSELAAGRADFDFLRHPLLPYQHEGVLHLAFSERALLADEMGLGKTVQAIAACELLARRRDVARVLVVCPASLKTEWEEQIARFVERSVRVVFGARAQRLAAYREPAFFTIVNYEQVLGDAEEINGLLAPDVVILDEAQRIKNWRTKTAHRVKSLRSPFAFVLTGTPVENRIDEIYSIVQFLDPEISGPLFRFNRDFYRLDEKGRPVDYQNLGELHRRLQPVMLRRRKQDVEGELPGRTVKTYFVAMAEEQRARYEDYNYPARQLIARAQRRPLTQAEFDRLQQLLACMRMVCDSPAILDPTCRISPKLEELEGILGDLLEDPDRKIIVFSEWERMLRLVRELAGEMGVECAWHTGSLPQQRRRAEINRFKHDPACRLFLSTDSGSVGLNLQAASAVVNIDLPWNPAKLEQRIARAWRKNQTRSVTVVNLVAEDSIEHSILHLLGQKQALADGLLDGDADFATLRMPSGRVAMIERMQAMLDARPSTPRIVSAEESVADDLRRRYDGRLVRVEAHSGRDGRMCLLAVLDADKAALAAETARQASAARADGPDVELVDRETWALMSRLAGAGVLRFAEEAGRVLYRAPEASPDSGREAA